ncbi:MAG TPA: hypothetical protein VLC10_05150 [Patescibacteria group bacterium]|nr:hypothetical protein [Patescibacteria group bacterium]
MADINDALELDEAPVGYYSTEYMGWNILEYPKYERGRAWYIGMGVFGVGLLIYAVVSANFLFALIIIMFALVTYLSSMSEPKTIKFAITDNGVVVGRSFYMYKDLSRFWFIYEPPEVKTLYFEFKNSLRPRVTIDLGDINPNQVRQVLGNFVREDFNEDDEPFSDFVGRVLKI